MRASRIGIEGMWWQDSLQSDQYKGSFSTSAPGRIYSALYSIEVANCRLYIHTRYNCFQILYGVQHVQLAPPGGGAFIKAGVIIRMFTVSTCDRSVCACEICQIISGNPVSQSGLIMSSGVSWSILAAAPANPASPQFQCGN